MAYALINYKKAYCVFLIFQLFWYNSASLISIGGRNITESLGMNFFFLVLYLLKYSQLKKGIQRFPYTVPFIMISISYFITCFTAVGGFGDEFLRAVSSFVQFITNVWLMWRIITKKRDFEFLFKAFTISFFIACIYGLFEYVMHINPLFEIKSAITEGGINNYNTDFILNSDRGYRMLSIFEHPIGAGMNFALYASFVLIATVKSKEKLPFNRFAIFTAVLCILCIVLTKMRSAMLFAVIATIPIIDFKRKRFYKIMGLLFIFLIVSWPFINSYLGLFITLFNKEALLHNSTGSSITQRISQFQAVYSLMMQSPIGGLGQKFSNYISNSYTKAALGYESVWLEQMARNGLMGVTANIVLLIYSVIIVPRKYKSKEILWLSLAYWGVYSVSSIPSFRIAIYYLIIIYYIKKSNKCIEYKHNQSNQNFMPSIDFNRSNSTVTIGRMNT